jgi:hypothetical protein
VAKRDYTEDPPSTFGKMFVKSCMTCEHLGYHGKYWHVCEEHHFRLRDRADSLTSVVCGSWDVSRKVLKQWKKEK